MLPRLAKVAIFIVVFGTLSNYSPVAESVVSSCTASVSPISIPHQPIGDSVTIITRDLTFSINNTGSSTIAWVKLTAPSNNFTVNASNSSGWSSVNTNLTATFTPGTLGAGLSADFVVNVYPGTIDVAAADWTVQVSDDSNGGSPTTCTGSTAVAISGDPPRTDPPEFSDLILKDVSSSSVTITWTTDEEATSSVDWGLTSNYGSNKSDSSMVTTHSITLDGLSVNTVYYYNVKGTDASGNTGEMGNNTLTTAKEGTTTTITIVATPTPSPKPVADKVAPRAILVDTDFSKEYSEVPKIGIEAFDTGGVARIEYSTDGGLSWLVVPNVPNLGSATISFSFTPILADGTYSLQVRASDKVGNIGYSEKGSLIIDKTPPKVALVTDFSKPFVQAPEVSGNASDASGIEKIEYSTDDGANWLPVDKIGQASSPGGIVFTFKPSLVEDGNYQVRIRARDIVGNEAVTDASVLIIDRLPPRIGPALYSIGPRVLTLEEGGQVVTLSGVGIKVTVTGVGGPTSVTIEARGVGQEEAAPIATVPLGKNPDNGLWSGQLLFANAGTYELVVKSSDGAGNKQERKLNDVIVLDLGKIEGEEGPVANAKITLWYFQPSTARFVLWDGTSYSQDNPQNTDGEGKYRLLVSAGKYYLQINAAGYKTLKTNIFTADRTLPIVSDFKLEVARRIKIGPFKLNLPDFRISRAQIGLSYPQIPKEVRLKNDNVGKGLPNFTFGAQNMQISNVSLRGKPTILTFLNTWSPQASEQLSAMEQITTSQNVGAIAIMSEEATSSASIFKRRGNYKIPIFADADGELVEPLGLLTEPTHFFLDRNGIIKKIKVGVLNKEELIDNLVSL